MKRYGGDDEIQGENEKADENRPQFFNLNRKQIFFVFSVDPRSPFG
jgi:hypothetical protein